MWGRRSRKWRAGGAASTPRTERTERTGPWTAPVAGAGERVVLVSFGDDEVSITLAVTGRWQPGTPSSQDADVLQAELVGESELGTVRATPLLLPSDLDDIEALGDSLVAGEVSRAVDVYERPGGRMVWESNDRDARLVLTFVREDDGLVCTTAEMTGIHGWPGFRMPVDEPVEDVGEALLAGVERVGAAYPPLTRQPEQGVWERLPDS